MDEHGAEQVHALSLLDVLALWPCAHAIFEHVPVRDLVRSERVSRRWQLAVHDYLRSCRTLSFINPECSLFCKKNANKTTSHRTIQIKPDKNSFSWPLVLKTLVKLGSSIVKVTTNCCKDNIFEAIALNCPYLRHVVIHHEFIYHLPLIKLQKCKELKDISFISVHNISDQQLGEVFQIMNWEKIRICSATMRVIGSFLKSVNPGSLHSLRLETCHNLNIHELHASIYNLRNITCLGLDSLRLTVLANINVLLGEMPKLEELSLRNYHQSGNLSKEVIKCFGRLNNLKRLDMSYNSNVNDALLEELARGCPKLEYLNLYGTANKLRLAGLAALCRRTLSVVTLHVAYQPRRASQYSVTFDWSPNVVEELDALDCVRLSPDNLESAGKGWYPYHLRAGTGSQEVNHNRELKVILANVYVLNEFFIER